MWILRFSSLSRTLDKSALYVVLALLFWMSLNSGWAQQVTVDLAEEPCAGVCRIAETNLPLQALPRVASNLYADKSVESEIVEANLKPFYPLWVFAREDLVIQDGVATGWYAVGDRRSAQPRGWMRAEDVLEWRQALVAAFAHPGPIDFPGRRQPVMMFENIIDLSEVADEDDVRADLYRDYLKRIEEGDVPDGVITMETRRFVDIDEPGNFYILPIIQFEQVFFRDGDARYLQLAAATGGSQARRSAQPSAGTLKDSAFLSEALATEADAGAGGLGAVDIMIVMDLTSSMQPVVDKTLEAIAFMADQLARQASVNVDIRFGLVGYRDDESILDTLEFTAKLFTPEFLDGDDFSDLLRRDVRAARASSDDYAEEVYAGVDLALAEAPWRDDSLRFMVIAGDASPHEPGHPQATTPFDAPALRDRMTQKAIHTVALHLLNPRATADHPIARAAFMTLASNEGTEAPTYFTARFDAAEDSQESVAYQIKLLAQTLSMRIGELKGGAAESVAKSMELVPEQAGGSLMEDVVGAALVKYLGKEADPPADLTFWAMDRDMADTTREALSVRVLISQNELNDLVVALRWVREALDNADLNYSDFVTELQAILTTALKDQDIDIDRTQRLSRSSLLPRWLNSLPYKSPLMNMTLEEISGMQAGDREGFANAVQARIELYENFLSEPEIWVQLSETDSVGDSVIALRLDDLP